MEELKETIIDVEDNVKSILKRAVQSKSKSVKRVSSVAGVVSVVNAKSGKRITLSKILLEKLNNPKSIQIAFTEDSIIIAEELPDNKSLFNIKMSNDKGIIYSAQLVMEITELFSLEFNNKTSITFGEAEYALNDDYVVAIVQAK